MHAYLCKIAKDATGGRVGERGAPLVLYHEANIALDSCVTEVSVYWGLGQKHSSYKIEWDQGRSTRANRIDWDDTRANRIDWDDTRAHRIDWNEGKSTRANRID